MTSASEVESSVRETPQWLEVLENKRKRPHKLAHEIGAGAPCLICKEKCTGLNLHFWRKLCIECKCRKEDHEVQDEEDFAQFEILFGAKKVKRTTLKFNAQNKSFDWIPPNVSPELALDYLNSIPKSKLPISNSEGARYRKQQLEKQLPLHDVDPNACHELSDNEMKEFQRYLENLKKNVVGQGKILKYFPKMLRENHIRTSPTNITKLSEEYNGIKPQGTEIKGHLSMDKTSSFDTSTKILNTQAYPADALLNVKLYKYSQPITTNIDYHPLETKSLEKNKNFDTPSQQLINKYSGLNIIYPKPFSPAGNFNNEDYKNENSESSGNDFKNIFGLKTPSSFIKKSPIQDKKNNNPGFSNKDNNKNEKMGDFSLGDSLHYSCDDLPRNLKYNLREGNEMSIPCKSALCKDPLGKFSELNVSSNEVPFSAVQEAGNIYSPNKSNVNNESEGNLNCIQSQIGKEFSTEFPAPPSTCQQCLDILYPEEVVVQTERGNYLAFWHAKCFVCDTCKELLVDLMYFFNKGKVYCGRHYAEIMKIPRCYACDELIFVKEYTIAEGESYHVRHFCCFHCDEPLGGKQYIYKDNQPVCLNCYQIKYGKTCRTCQKAIGAGEQRVSWKDLDYHVYPQCFRCAKCLKSLLGGKFVVKNSNTFCSKECVQESE